MSTAALNRRAFERFKLQPMYTDARVQRVDGGRMSRIDGYAVDISEGGVRVQLDERLELGEHVNLSLRLPGDEDDADEGGGIHLACQVVWMSDEEDDPVMPRIALRICRYLSDYSRRRLLDFLGSGVCARAA